jgi:hypothetical protein
MKLTPSLIDRMAGLCALCAVMIAGYRFKIVWWLGITHAQRSNSGVAGSLLLGAFAIVGALGCWRRNRWGYVAIFVLAAIENISGVAVHFSLQANARMEDAVTLMLSGAPLLAAMLAAAVLLLAGPSKSSLVAR